MHWAIISKRVDDEIGGTVVHHLCVADDGICKLWQVREVHQNASMVMEEPQC